jgi:hypothetical protein
MRLAFKAQSQSRATIETLAAIKNPPVVFTRQANIANGPQQVNQVNMGLPSHAGENEIPQAKQSGYENELLPNLRASALASRVDPPLETVEALNGADHGNR